MTKLSRKAKMSSEALMTFIDEAPTPFHAIQVVVDHLNNAYFEELKEEEIWKIKPGGRYYTIREDATIAAWLVGKQAPADSGLRIIGSHTDSPNLRIKPQPNIQKHGYQQLGVEVYGGVLLSSWADRDLSLAGRVMVAGKNYKSMKKWFIKMDRPLLRIPLLAIHLNREVNTKGLLLNKQNHLAPILELASDDAGGRPASSRPTGDHSDDPLRMLLGKELKVSPEKIIDFDLSLYDLQPSSFLGANQEFIAAPRLDNLYSCFCSLQALLAVCQQSKIPESTLMMAAFDNEEIGSLTTQGARSSFLKNVIRRINEAPTKVPKQAYERSLANSLFLSADMAHAVHPNYSEKHDPEHFPYINQGPVIKVNAQGSYATSGYSSANFEMICKRRDIPIQKFVNRTDLVCGSTIGPFIASDLGMKTIDVGAAMLSMHSIREMCGSSDPHYMIEAFKGFYQDNLS